MNILDVRVQERNIVTLHHSQSEFTATGECHRTADSEAPLDPFVKIDSLYRDRLLAHCQRVVAGFLMGLEIYPFLIYGASCFTRRGDHMNVVICG